MRITNPKLKAPESSYSIVYIALGKNHDPLLTDYATFAKLNSEESKLLLISDSPSNYKKFPGQIMRYRPSLRIENTMRNLRAGRPHLRFVAKEYWFKTFERLLALEMLLEDASITFPIIHLENDILYFANYSHMEIFSKYFNSAAALRWSTIGNCGALFIPNKSALTSFVSHLHAAVHKFIHSKEWSIDMPIIGDLLDRGLVETLPVVASESTGNVLRITPHIESNGRILLCDSLDLGTYLYGRNPIYNNGRVSEGFIYKHVRWNIKNTQWKLSIHSAIQNRYSLQMKLDDLMFEVLFLHINSKLNLARLGGHGLRQTLKLNEWISKADLSPYLDRARSVHKESRIRRFARRFFVLLHGRPRSL